MKHTNKSTKRAFTLIELLIVIAIIGILFVVLVSRVDFATDKAKASGVQTDFRSFQVAFDTVSKENAGFASLGWDTGDENGNRKRDSYDEGDTNKNNIMESTETWTGHKVPGENWTGTYTLVNPDDNTDKSAFKLLEDKVNANLDPKLHITITPEENSSVLTGNAKVTMANGAQDPWKNEYHGVYITNALNDGGMDRGAFIIYSNGANGKWGSEHNIANGNVSITVPGNNVRGKDDYSMSVFYSYANGYGEIAVVTTGFSNNQKFLGGAPEGELDVIFPEAGTENIVDESKLIEFTVGTFEMNTNYTPGQYMDVPYEVTKIREKKPVSYSQTISWTGYPDTVNLASLEPFINEYESEYIVYSVAKASGSNANGYVQVHCNQLCINNASDDTLDNAIYLAAYWQKLTNGGKYKVAKWNGSEYIQMDCSSQINAITDFTESYTVVEHKQVLVSAPSVDSSLVYVPSGSMQALEGMTWEEWLASEFNTVGATKIWDNNGDEISLNSIIVANKNYGFKLKNNSTWPLIIDYTNVDDSMVVVMDGMPLCFATDVVPSVFEMAMSSLCCTKLGFNLEYAVTMNFIGCSAIVYTDAEWSSMFPIVVVERDNTYIAEYDCLFEKAGTYVLYDEALVSNSVVLTIGSISITYQETITDSWDEINTHIQLGDYKEKYCLGDTKMVSTSNGINILMEIVAFDTDVKADGTTAAITWMSKEVVFGGSMESTEDVIEGWVGSNIRKILQDDLYNCLSADVRNMIVPVVKSYQDYDNKVRTTKTCIDNIWMPSYREMFGGDASADQTMGEDFGVYYEYFNNDAARIKTWKGESTSYTIRTATGFAAGNEGYMYIKYNGRRCGVSASDHANTPGGIVVAFCT